MIEQDLLDAGYKKFNGAANSLKSSDYYYAKMFTDTIGKKYQIDIYVYSKDKYPTQQQHDGFMPDVQFRINAYKDDEYIVDITYHCWPDTSLCVVEKYYESLWGFHGKPYYELYERK